MQFLLTRSFVYNFLRNTSKRRQLAPGSTFVGKNLLHLIFKAGQQNKRIFVNIHPKKVFCYIFTPTRNLYKNQTIICIKHHFTMILDNLQQDCQIPKKKKEKTSHKQKHLFHSHFLQTS